MTARTVNGLEVIEDQPTVSPIKAFDGRQVTWTQTRTLLLADGSTIYGCAHCEFTSTNVLSIRPHLGKHNGAKGDRAPSSTTGDVDALIRRLQELTKIEADRDRWRERAKAAERDLAALRAALGRVAR